MTSGRTFRTRLRLGALFLLLPALTLLAPAAHATGSPNLVISQVYTRGSNAVYIVGLITALMTAFYMTRMMRLIFFGVGKVEQSPVIALDRKARSCGR